MGESLGDLDQMLLSDAEISDGHVSVHAQMQFVEDGPGSAVQLFRIDDAESTRLAAEEDVLGNRKLTDQR